MPAVAAVRPIRPLRRGVAVLSFVLALTALPVIGLGAPGKGPDSVADIA